MFQTIIKASENFCIHQIREEHKIGDIIPNTKMIITYIDIDADNGEKHRVYLASDKIFMQKISTLFLEEDESDEETLIDMALETTNLIVGSAKVIAEETNHNIFTINTPNFIEFDSFNLEYEESQTIEIDTHKLVIAMKKINS